MGGQVPSAGLSQSRLGSPSLAVTIFDPLAILQCSIQGHHCTVDPGTAATMSEVGVHRIGKSTGVAPRSSATTLPCGVST